jgi:hypothetical protein
MTLNAETNINNMSNQTKNSQTQPNTLPRKAVKSIGFGLFLMAFFTMVWTGIAQAGLQGQDNRVVLVVFATISAAFVAYGIRLLVAAQNFPKFTTAADEAEGKKISKAFGLVFGIEGAAIPFTCVILKLLGLQAYILPAIALIVGLHFYPMAKIFKRKIDYYLGTWACVIAVMSINFIYSNGQSQAFIFTFLGIGLACTTTAYGFYMLLTGYKLINNQTR